MQVTEADGTERTLTLATLEAETAGEAAGDSNISGKEVMAVSSSRLSTESPL